MYQNDKWWSSKSVTYLIAVLSVAVILAVTAIKVHSQQINFSLKFNIFSTISLAAALIDATVCYLIIIKKNYSDATRWFVLFVLGAIFMAVTEGLQRSSVYPSGALFWQNLSFICLALLPVAFYLFIVSYTNQQRKHFMLLGSLLIFIWGMASFFGGNGIYFSAGQSQVIHRPWGYLSNPTHAEVILVAWFILFYILGTGLLLQFRRSTQNKIIKKQAVLFIVAFLAPFLAAIVTIVILPTVANNPIPPLASFVGAFSAIIVYYGVRRYKLFELDPQLLAQNILETMSEAVIITRIDMSVESINRSAQHLLGIETNKIKEVDLKDFFSESDWKLINEKVNNRSINQDQAVSKAEVKTSNNKLIPVRIAVSSLVDEGERVANIIVLSDISEISRSFDVLEKSASHIYQQNDELRVLQRKLVEEKANVEHTVQVRTKELIDAQNKIKLEDKLKTEFIMLTSHGLRTPYTVAKGYSELLASHELPPEDKKLVEGLMTGLKRLGGLIEQLLTINTIESGKLENSTVITCQDLMEPLVQNAKELVKVRSNQLIASIDAKDTKINANPKRLQGAIGNLIDNACKFTNNGTIQIKTEKNGKSLVISIVDSGIGIQPDELPNLFNKFHRAENRLNNSFEGDGIGLYISKLIIEEHSGKINVTSQLGKGSTFTIELPCL